MSTTFSVLIFLLIIALIIFLIWNIFLFKNIRNTNNSNKDYLELKYQMQFYIAVFSVLIGLFSFLGYSSYKDIEANVKSEILTQTEDIIRKSKNDLNDKIESTKLELLKISFENERIKTSNKDVLDNNEKTNDRFYKLYEQFINLNKELNGSQRQLQSQIDNVNNAKQDVLNIKNDVEEIKKIDFLNQVYIVTDVSYIETNKSLDTIYFKDLKTIGGNQLPKFSKPPSITISPYQGIQLSLKEVTNTYYTIYMWTKTEWEEKEKHKYDLIIIYKDASK